MSASRDPVLTDLAILLDGDTEPTSVSHEVEDRWLLAFATAVGSAEPQHIDLEHPGGLMAHPLFPACLEWPLIDAGIPGTSMSPAVFHRGLHVAHSIVHHQPIRGGTLLTTEGRLTAAEVRSSAAVLSVEFLTFAGEDLLTTTTFQSYYPGVSLRGAGNASPSSHRPEASFAADVELQPAGAPIVVDRTNAVLYSECSRIWNPIHTDPRVARAANLRQPLLHGTEILGRATSQIQNSGLIPTGAVIKSVAARFARPVFPGAVLTVLAGVSADGQVHFCVEDSSGSRAVERGVLTVD